MGIMDRYQDYMEKDEELEIGRLYSNWEEQRKEMVQNITTKQAVKALGHNFVKWVKNHKVEIAAAATALAGFGALCKVSTDISNHILVKDESPSSGRYPYNKGPMSYYNIHKYEEGNCLTEFVMLPLDERHEFSVTPEQMTSILNDINTGYADIYKQKDTVNHELKITHYDDGHTETMQN
jgi:hypothetical protein